MIADEDLDELRVEDSDDSDRSPPAARKPAIKNHYESYRSSSGRFEPSESASVQSDTSSELYCDFESKKPDTNEVPTVFSKLIDRVRANRRNQSV